MKKLLVIISIIYSLSASAQSLSFGPEVGLNIINVDKTDLKGQLYKLGFDAGGFVQYKVANSLSVKANINYTSKGISYYNTTTSEIDESLLSEISNLLTEGDFDLDTSITNNISNFVNTNIESNYSYYSSLKYIEVPVSIVYDINDKVFFSAGVYGAYLLSANTKEQLSQEVPLLESITALQEIEYYDIVVNMLFPGYQEPQIENISSSSIFNQFDYGLKFDIAYNSKGFRTIFSTSYGLNDVIKTKEDYSIATNKHLVFKFSIAYNINNLIIKQKQTGLLQ